MDIINKQKYPRRSREKETECESLVTKTRKRVIIMKKLVSDMDIRKEQ